jgi:protocatechuate 3,4-dioxygenase beta subunit
MRPFRILLWLFLLITVAVACSSRIADMDSSNPVAAGQINSDDVVIERYRKVLERNPDDPNAYAGLRQMLERSQPVSDSQVRLIREILHRFSRAGKTSLVNNDEPGERLIAGGKVKDEVAHPIPDAIIYVFQTDANGHYSRGSIMNEGNPRLFAYIKSAKDGSFEFETIRPGGYPAPRGREDEQNLIPQHIHLQVSAPGYQFRNLEFVFADDPRLTPYWREWAVKRGHPIVTVVRDQNHVQRGVADIILRPE